MRSYSLEFLRAFFISIALLAVLLVLPACEEEEETVDVDSLKSLLTGVDPTVWTPVMILNQRADSTDIDTVFYIADTSDTPRDTLQPLLIHRYRTDGNLLISTADGDSVRAWQWELDDQGIVRLSNDSTFAEPYHQIVEVTADSLRVNVVNSRIEANYDFYQILFYAD